MIFPKPNHIPVGSILNLKKKARNLSYHYRKMFELSKKLNGVLIQRKRSHSEYKRPLLPPIVKSSNISFDVGANPTVAKPLNRDELKTVIQRVRKALHLK